MFTEPLASPHTDRQSVRVTRRLGPAALVGLLALSVAQAPAADASASATSSSTSSSATSATGATTLSSATFESRLFVRTNVRRQRHGCRPLRLNGPLALAARRHSELMSYRDDLSHRLAGEGDLAQRAVAAGYTPWRMLAENLAWGQPTPRAVFRAWVNSPGHRANLDNCRLRDVGFGVVIRDGRPWVTADFGRHA
jgi:uncharacterized protein YkwD